MARRLLLPVLAGLLLAADGGALPQAAAGRSRSPAEPLATAAPATGPLEARQVADFRLANDAAAASPPRTVSFGQVFRRGAVRPGQSVSVRLDGRAAPTQLDPKARYPDGSVRHAVLTVRTPPVAPGGSVSGVVFTAAREELPRAGAVRDPPDLQLVLNFLAGPLKGRTSRTYLAALARSANARRPPAWLSGPLVREQRFTADLAGGLQAAFDVWTPAEGASRVDVVLRNDSARNAGIGTQVYAAVVTLNGAVVRRAERVAHHPYSTWRWRIRTDASPLLRVVPDTRLLEEVGAVPRYARLRPDVGAAEALHKLAVADGRPLATAGVTPYMPTTGGRPDIGPLPAWAVFYLLDPSRRNLETLLGNADAAGSVPWHVRDPATNGPITIDRRPEVWLDERGHASPGVLDRAYVRPDTPWQPDDAHQPSLSYLPYLLTGSQYDRDELAMQAAYVLLAINPEYRGRGAGLVLGSQVRAVAWDLRTLAEAAFILPADDPLQRYFQSRLDANLHEIVRRYVTGREADASGELRGYLPGPYAVEGTVPPWQQDYLVIVLGWIDAMGSADARAILAWMTNFTAGRFTSGGRGYDPIYGTPYYLFVADPRTHKPLARWSEAFQATFDPKLKPVTALDYPDWGGGYAALARASLASIVNATHSPQALAAYRYVESRTPGMASSFPKEPAFAIAPVDAGER